MDYTAETLRAQELAHLKKEYPYASAARLADLAEKILIHAGCGLSTFKLDQDILDRHREFIASHNPDLLLPVPSDKLVHDAIVAKEAERLKIPTEQVDGAWKLNEAHKLKDLDDESRFAALVGYTPPAEPTVAAPAPSAPSSVESLNAELVRMGYDVSQLLPLERQRLYRLVDRQRVEAAKVTPGSADDLSLPPAQRMTLARQAEKAEKAAAAPKPPKAGVRDSATGLPQDRRGTPR